MRFFFLHSVVALPFSWIFQATRARRWQRIERENRTERRTKSMKPGEIERRDGRKKNEKPNRWRISKWRAESHRCPLPQSDSLADRFTPIFSDNRRKIVKLTQVTSFSGPMQAFPVDSTFRVAIEVIYSQYEFYPIVRFVTRRNRTLFTLKHTDITLKKYFSSIHTPIRTGFMKKLIGSTRPPVREALWAWPTFQPRPQFRATLQARVCLFDQFQMVFGGYT